MTGSLTYVMLLLTLKIVTSSPLSKTMAPLLQWKKDTSTTLAHQLTTTKDLVTDTTLTEVLNSTDDTRKYIKSEMVKTTPNSWVSFKKLMSSLKEKFEITTKKTTTSSMKDVDMKTSKATVSPIFNAEIDTSTQVQDLLISTKNIKDLTIEKLDVSKFNTKPTRKPSERWENIKSTIKPTFEVSTKTNNVLNSTIDADNYTSSTDETDTSIDMDSNTSITKSDVLPTIMLDIESSTPVQHLTTYGTNQTTTQLHVSKSTRSTTKNPWESFNKFLRTVKQAFEITTKSTIFLTTTKIDRDTSTTDETDSSRDMESHISTPKSGVPSTTYFSVTENIMMDTASTSAPDIISLIENYDDKDSLPMSYTSTTTTCGTKITASNPGADVITSTVTADESTIIKDVTKETTTLPDKTIIKDHMEKDIMSTKMSNTSRSTDDSVKDSMALPDVTKTIDEMNWDTASSLALDTSTLSDAAAKFTTNISEIAKITEPATKDSTSTPVRNFTPPREDVRNVSTTISNKNSTREHVQQDTVSTKVPEPSNSTDDNVKNAMGMSNMTKTCDDIKNDTVSSSAQDTSNSLEDCKSTLTMSEITKTTEPTMKETASTLAASVSTENTEIDLKIKSNVEAKSEDLKKDTASTIVPITISLAPNTSTRDLGWVTVADKAKTTEYDNEETTSTRVAYTTDSTEDSTIMTNIATSIENKKDNMGSTSAPDASNSTKDAGKETTTVSVKATSTGNVKTETAFTSALNISTSTEDVGMDTTTIFDMETTINPAIKIKASSSMVDKTTSTENVGKDIKHVSKISILTELKIKNITSLVTDASDFTYGVGKDTIVKSEIAPTHTDITTYTENPVRKTTTLYKIFKIMEPRVKDTAPTSTTDESSAMDDMNKDITVMTDKATTEENGKKDMTFTQGLDSFDPTDEAKKDNMMTTSDIKETTDDIKNETASISVSDTSASIEYVGKETPIMTDLTETIEATMKDSTSSTVMDIKTSTENAKNEKTTIYKLSKIIEPTVRDTGPTSTSDMSTTTENMSMDTTAMSDQITKKDHAKNYMAPTEVLDTFDTTDEAEKDMTSKSDIKKITDDIKHETAFISLSITSIASEHVGKKTAITTDITETTETALKDSTSSPVTDITTTTENAERDKTSLSKIPKIMEPTVKNTAPSSTTDKPSAPDDMNRDTIAMTDKATTEEDVKMNKAFTQAPDTFDPTSEVKNDMMTTSDIKETTDGIKNETASISVSDTPAATEYVGKETPIMTDITEITEATMKDSTSSTVIDITTSTENAINEKTPISKISKKIEPMIRDIAPISMADTSIATATDNTNKHTTTLTDKATIKENEKNYLASTQSPDIFDPTENAEKDTMIVSDITKITDDIKHDITSTAVSDTSGEKTAMMSFTTKTTQLTISDSTSNSATDVSKYWNNNTATSLAFNASTEDQEKFMMTTSDKSTITDNEKKYTEFTHAADTSHSTDQNGNNTTIMSDVSKKIIYLSTDTSVTYYNSISIEKMGKETTISDVTTTKNVIKDTQPLKMSAPEKVVEKNTMSISDMTTTAHDKENKAFTLATKVPESTDDAGKNSMTILDTVTRVEHNVIKETTTKADAIEKFASNPATVTFNSTEDIRPILSTSTDIPTITVTDEMINSTSSLVLHAYISTEDTGKEMTTPLVKATTLENFMKDITTSSSLDPFSKNDEKVTTDEGSIAQKVEQIFEITTTVNKTSTKEVETDTSTANESDSSKNMDSNTSTQKSDVLSTINTNNESPTSVQDLSSPDINRPTTQLFVPKSTIASTKNPWDAFKKFSSTVKQAFEITTKANKLPITTTTKDIVLSTTDVSDYSRDMESNTNSTLTPEVLSTNTVKMESTPVQSIHIVTTTPTENPWEGLKRFFLSVKQAFEITTKDNKVSTYTAAANENTTTADQSNSSGNKELNTSTLKPNIISTITTGTETSTKHKDLSIKDVNTDATKTMPNALDSAITLTSSKPQEAIKMFNNNSVNISIEVSSSEVKKWRRTPKVGKWRTSGTSKRKNKMKISWNVS